MHFFQKTLCDGESGAFPNDGIDAAVGTKSGIIVVSVKPDPLIDLPGAENIQAIETAAFAVLLQLKSVIAAVFMRF